MKRILSCILVLCLMLTLFLPVNADTVEDGDPTTETIDVEGVTLSPFSLSMKVGETYSLSAVVSPSDADNQSVSWSTYDPKIADVDINGVVTATGIGNTVIEVMTADGGYTADCDVSVGIKTVPVIGVSLDCTALTLTQGESHFLHASVLPSDASDQTVNWTSDDPSIVLVSEDGKISAVMPGTAVVSVITKDGNHTAQCMITVLPKITVIPVDGISMQEELSLTVGDSVTLYAAVLPEDAADRTVTWSSDSPQAVSVDENGTVTAHTDGTATITAVTNDGGYSATCFVTVTKPVQIPTEENQETYSFPKTEDYYEPFEPWNYYTPIESFEPAEIPEDKEAENEPQMHGSFENFVKINEITEETAFADVSSGEWYAENVRGVYELGLMIGTGESNFSPKNPIRLDELIVLAARIRDCYFDLHTTFDVSSDWFSGYLRYAVENRIIDDDTYPDYNVYATRADFVSVMAAAFPEKAWEGIHEISFSDIPDVDGTESYAEDVLSFYRAGILTGTDEARTFNPTGTITRAEAAAIVSRIVIPALRKPTVTED